MKKNKKRSLYSIIMGFVNRTGDDHVGAYAAQAAFFMIMSFMPFIMFLTAMIKYTPLTYGMMRQVIISVIPENLQEAVMGIVVDIYSQNTAVYSISSVAVALWSSGKGVMSLINGLNTIYHVHETRNWLLKRIQSVFYTFLFVIALIASLLILVMGNRIQMLLSRYIPFLGQIVARIIGARTLIVFSALFLIFLLLYKFLPNRKASLKSQIPGALVTAVAWSLFSYGFSLYFSFFPGFNNMYNESLAGIILIMMWVYICMNLLLYGAEINAYFEKQFRQAEKSVQELLAREKNKDAENKSESSAEKREQAD